MKKSAAFVQISGFRVAGVAATALKARPGRRRRQSEPGL